MVTKKVTVVWMQEYFVDVANETTDVEIEEMARQKATILDTTNPLILDIEEVDTLNQPKNENILIFGTSNGDS